MQHRLLSVAVFALFTAGAQASDGAFVLTKGPQDLCAAFAAPGNNIRTVEPTLRKGDAELERVVASCPKIVLKPRWMKGSKTYDDYATYRVDIDNDGTEDNVFYRRWEYDEYTTVSEGGVESRQFLQRQSVGELLLLDASACRLNRLFGGSQVDIVAVSKRIYIRDVQRHDVQRKTMSIYLKSGSQPMKGGYQDDLCRFEVR
jgi:hypothetical protein